MTYSTAISQVTQAFPGWSDVRSPQDGQTCRPAGGANNASNLRSQCMGANHTRNDDVVKRGD